MTDLFMRWRGLGQVNSLRAVDAYMQELPGFRRIAVDPKARAGMLDFAMFLRERTVTLAAEGASFGDDDLAVMAAAGQDRAAAGISPADQQHVLLLHTSLTLREVHEAAGPHDIDDLLRVVRWLPTQGAAAQAAYTRGYLRGQETRLPVGERVRVLTNLLLTGDAMAADLAASLAMTVPARYVVLVVRMPDARRPNPPRAEILAELLTRHWVPLSWEHPEEFIALIDAGSAPEKALALARDLGQLVNGRCAVGAAEEAAGELAGALAQAREVSRTAPLESVPGTVFYRTDLFAELGVARVPPVDGWLRDVARRLASGPQLITTLDVFYRNNLGRTLTAAALGVHPRTVDYRLRRVRELTGLDPVSVRGVRILSTAVTRFLAGA
jgi:hypothetical protein